MRIILSILLIGMVFALPGAVFSQEVFTEEERAEAARGVEALFEEGCSRCHSLEAVDLGRGSLSLWDWLHVLDSVRGEAPRLEAVKVLRLAQREHIERIREQIHALQEMLDALGSSF